jgi:ABC-type transport system substrate-binding protein
MDEAQHLSWPGGARPGLRVERVARHEYLAEKGGTVDVEFIGIEGQMNSVGTSAQQQFAQLDGVNLEVKFLPALGMRDAYYSGNFDIGAYILSGVNGYPELPQYVGTGQPRDFAGFSDPAVDAALAQIIATDDQDTINQAYAEVAATVLDQMPYAVLWATDVRTYAQDHQGHRALPRPHRRARADLPRLGRRRRTRDEQ